MTLLTGTYRGLRLGVLTIGMLLAATASYAAEGAKTEVFSDTEKGAIGEVVRDYLIANPQLMLEVMDALDAYESRVEKEQHRLAIAANLDALERDGYSFVAGNPDGAVTVVEFFDYRCPYCKQTADDMQTLIDEHDDVRLVLKEFPILGPGSTVASRAAIAAIPQGKYLDLHFALLRSKGTLDRDAIMEIAEDVGLDTKRLARDMESEKIDMIIDTNRELALEVGVKGTPAFIIGDTLLPGAAPIEEIESRLQDVRDTALKAANEAG